MIRRRRARRTSQQALWTAVQALQEAREALDRFTTPKEISAP